MNTPALFEYAGLAADDELEARAAAERIRTRMRRTAEDIVEIGRDLIAVKERLGHGRFGDWLQAEFEMGPASAARFMQVAERFGKSTTMINLPPTVIYALAAPSTPDEVVTKATEKAAAGETVTLAEVQRLKAELTETRRKAEENLVAGMEENERAFEEEREKLKRAADAARVDLAEANAKVAKAQQAADLAAEVKYKAKADKMAEAAVLAKQRELGDIRREHEAKQRDLNRLNEQIAIMEKTAQDRADHAKKIADDAAEERHLLEVLYQGKEALIQLAGAFESRTNDSYSEHFNGQVRGFLRMLDMTRQSVAAAGEKILELEAEVISP